MTKYSFKPDFAVAPGETLRETLEQKGISQSELCVRTGLAEKTVSQIINGIAPISHETAEKLELVTGVPASFWNRRELAYREHQVRAECIEKFALDVAWLKELPIKELLERKLIAPFDESALLVREALRFFGVSSVEAWRNIWANPEVQFRGKEAQDRRPGIVAAWLRIGELKAEKIECEPYDPKEFRLALKQIRKLTVEPASGWPNKIREFCAAAGVAVVFVREIPQAGVSGATRWITKDKALIQVSLKYKTDDQLWFSIFHEAGHVLLHGKRLTFLEFGHREDTDEEIEANCFAREMLIPSMSSTQLAQLKSKDSIRKFAQAIGVAPGIVVGRLQYDKILAPSHCNDLKQKLAWAPSNGK